MIKILLVILSLQITAFSQESAKSIMTAFIENSRILNEFKGVTYDVVADFKVNKKAFERIGAVIPQEYTVTSHQVFSGQKHFGSMKVVPETINDYQEYAWDGKMWKMGLSLGREKH